MKRRIYSVLILPDERNTSHSSDIFLKATIIINTDKESIYHLPAIKKKGNT